MVAPQTGVGFVGNPVQPVMMQTPTSGGQPQQTNTGGLGSYLSPTLLGTATDIIGSQAAGSAAAAGNQNAINTQTGTMGNINSLFGAQTGVGNEAFGTIGSTLGLNGQPANYSNFLNMPGYQFAVQQGTQAIDRQAEAAGNIYTPNTMANIGQYVAGTAMGDYNTYVNQLMQAAGFGAQANNTLSGAQLQTGGNISQLQSNIGQNRAGAAAGTAGAIGSFLNSPNGSAFTNAAGKIIGNGYNYLTGGGGGSSNGVTGTPDPNNPGYNTDGSLTQTPDNSSFYNPGSDPNASFNNIGYTDPSNPGP